MQQIHVLFIYLFICKSSSWDSTFATFWISVDSQNNQGAWFGAQIQNLGVLEKDSLQRSGRMQTLLLLHQNFLLHFEHHCR